VAIDSNVLRHSFERANGKSALYMVSAWGSQQRPVLSQPHEFSFQLGFNPGDAPLPESIS